MRQPSAEVYLSNLKDPFVNPVSTSLYFAGDTALWITGNWEVGNITEKTDFTTSIYPFPGSETCPDGGSPAKYNCS